MKSPIRVQFIDDTPPMVRVDKSGRIIGLPDTIIDQIADRVIEKLKADGSLNPDPRLCGGPF
jgi:hypothetical protein